MTCHNAYEQRKKFLTSQLLFLRYHVNLNRSVSDLLQSSLTRKANKNSENREDCQNAIKLYAYGSKLKFWKCFKKIVKAKKLMKSRGGVRVVRCRIAMPEVVSSNPGRGKINLQKVMGSDGKNCKYLLLFCLSYVKYAFGYGF